MDEQRLERALREGPPFATRYVPVALSFEAPTAPGPASAARLALVIAVTALLLVGMLAGLVAGGAFRDDGGPAANGWVAFVQSSDVYVVREGQRAHRLIGADGDGVDQVCPAFSPDGARLAHGEATGDGEGGTRDAALVISDMNADGTASESLRIDVGGAFPPPCATWSADGNRVAFSVPLTSPRNPEQSALGSAVWVVTVADGHVEVLPDLLATDLEWSPSGSELAIASGQSDLVPGESLRDGSIRLYDADSGTMRTLVGPSGVSSLTWSPDGRRIAYQRGADLPQEIWVAEVDGSGEQLLVTGFAAIRGIGPVWSPTGDHIVYQRMKRSGLTEAHDVVVVSPDGSGVIVMPELRLPSDPADAPPWRPSGVTWSPDGTALLYTVWNENVGSRERKAVVAVPVDVGSDPVVLHEDVDIFNADGESSLPIQSWAVDRGG
jgi:Tol biopolymer transport system component